MNGEKQLHSMRWILFWIFISLFLLIVFATFSIIFFNFGNPTEAERTKLFNVFIGEIGVAVIALFYTIFGLKKSKNKQKSNEIENIFPSMSTPSISIYKTERDHYHTLLETMSQKRPDDVEIISAGLSSRYQFIIDLLQLQIPIRVLTQSEDIAIDHIDTERLKTIIDSIRRSSPEKALRYLEIRAMACVASVRSIIVNYNNTDDSIGLISWYTYDKNKRIMGHNNPSLVLNGKSADGQLLLNFVKQTFTQNWDGSANRIVFPIDRKNRN